MANIEASQVEGDNNWALLLDPDGFVAEGTGDNFFIIKNDTVISPEGRNILRGVSRAYVMEELCPLGLCMIEKNIEPYDVYTADEAFMTGTPFCMLAGDQPEWPVDWQAAGSVRCSRGSSSGGRRIPASTSSARSGSGTRHEAPARQTRRPLTGSRRSDRTYRIHAGAAVADRRRPDAGVPVDELARRVSPCPVVRPWADGMDVGPGTPVRESVDDRRGPRRDRGAW